MTQLSKNKGCFSTSFISIRRFPLDWIAMIIVIVFFLLYLFDKSRNYSGYLWVVFGYLGSVIYRLTVWYYKMDKYVTDPEGRKILKLKPLSR